MPPLGKSNNPKGRPGIPGGVADQRRDARAWVMRLPVAVQAMRMRHGKRWKVKLYDICATDVAPNVPGLWVYVGVASIRTKVPEGQVLARLSTRPFCAALFRKA